MTRRPRGVSRSGFYHVMQRGAGRQIIFDDDSDRIAYLTYLSRALDRFGCDLIAWCLMDNHVHLLVRDNFGSLSEMMHYVATCYARHFNSRSDHVGPVFQDRFRSKPIESNQYLMRAVRYIHNNPSDLGVPRDEYRWSSYREYVSRPVLIDDSILLSLIGGRQAFEDFSSLAVEGYSPVRERRSVSEETLELLASELHDIDICSIKTLPKERRDPLLRRMKDAGMSIRQIERATGVGRRIVERATRQR